MRRNIRGDYDSGSNDCALSDAQRSIAPCGNHGVRPYESILFNDNPARTARVSKDDGAQTDRSTALYFYRLRVLVLQVHIIADVYALSDFNASEAMQERSNTCCTRDKPREQMKNPIIDAPRQRLHRLRKT